MPAGGVFNLFEVLEILSGIVGEFGRALEHRQRAFAALGEQFLVLGHGLGRSRGSLQRHSFDALQPAVGIFDCELGVVTAVAAPQPRTGRLRSSRTLLYVPGRCGREAMSGGKSGMH